MRSVGTVQTARPRSISSQSAPRTSPLRAAARTRNRSASLALAQASDASTASSAAATSECSAAAWYRLRCASPRRFGSTAYAASTGLSSRHLCNDQLENGREPLAELRRGVPPVIPQRPWDGDALGARNLVDWTLAEIGCVASESVAPLPHGVDVESESEPASAVVVRLDAGLRTNP